MSIVNQLAISRPLVKLLVRYGEHFIARKVKDRPALHATRTCKWSRGMAPLILNLGTRRGQCLALRSERFIPGAGYLLNRSLGGTENRSGRFAPAGN
jgi:hypothetical protein